MTAIQASSKEIGCLKAESRQQETSFITDICNHLDAVQLNSEDPEENWTDFRSAVHSLAVNNLGHASRKHQDWFDGNDEKIQGLLEEKHRLHKA